MQPTSTFLIGHFPDGEQRWAAIDATAHHLQPRVGERRFVAYMSPYPCEAAARQALPAEGATLIEPEVRKRRGK